MALVGDRERERTAASLRDHFVQGRLSVEEFGERTDLAFRARSRSDLRTALHGLPAQWQNGNDLLAAGVGMVHKGASIVAFFATATAWAICTFAIAIPCAVALLAVGPSTSVAIAFAAVWAVMTFALWRPWFRYRRSVARRMSG